VQTFTDQSEIFLHKAIVCFEDSMKIDENNILAL
jgi:hypothetical protein